MSAVAHSCGATAPTIQQLIYEHKVVLHCLLVEFAKVALPKADKPVQELEDDCSIGIAFRDGRNVDILVLDMAEGGAAESEQGRNAGEVERIRCKLFV